MTTASEFDRLDGESELSYIWRVGQLKDNDLIDMTWEELAEIFNRNLREPDEAYTSSAYRKKYALLKQAKAEVFDGEEPSTDADLCEEIVSLRRELEKERVKLRDERTEYRRLIREQARKETLDDMLLDSVNQLNKTTPLLSPSLPEKTPDFLTKEALLCFTDWHYGMVTDNIWNKFNPKICRERISNCVAWAKAHLLTNDIRKVNIAVLGDLAHGMINRVNLGSNKDVCDQIMEVAEILAEAINDISSIVDQVDVYSCYGNHLRSAQNKQDALPSDNMEKIIPWWLKQRLSDNIKVKINVSEYKEFTHINILGYNIVCVHGNDFNFKDIGIISNSLFNKLFGITVDYTISGDKHHYEEIEKFGIESILVSALCGTDDYANSQRLYGKPGQTLIIFNNEYGRESTYHIPVM